MASQTPGSRRNLKARGVAYLDQGCQIHAKEIFRSYSAPFLLKKGLIFVRLCCTHKRRKGSSFQIKSWVSSLLLSKVSRTMDILLTRRGSLPKISRLQYFCPSWNPCPSFPWHSILLFPSLPSSPSHHPLSSPTTPLLPPALTSLCYINNQLQKVMQLLCSKIWISWGCSFLRKHTSQ